VDEIIDKDNDEENWADSGTQSGGRSPPHDANDSDDSESGEDTYVSEKRTLKGMGIQNGKGIGKSTEGGKGKEMGQGKGNGKGKGMAKQISGVDDIPCTDTFQLQKERYKAAAGMEGKQEQVNYEPEPLPRVSVFSDNDSNCTEESDGKYDSKYDSGVHMHMADTVDAPDGIEFDGSVDMERDGDNEDE
jgi:hypothetical protein